MVSVFSAETGYREFTDEENVSILQDEENESSSQENESSLQRCCCIKAPVELTTEEFIILEARKLIHKERSEGNNENTSKICCQRTELPRPIKRAYSLGLSGFLHGVYSGTPLKDTVKDSIVIISSLLAIAIVIVNSLEFAKFLNETKSKNSSNDSNEVYNDFDSILAIHDNIGSATHFLLMFKLVVCIFALAFTSLSTFIHFEVRKCKTFNTWIQWCGYHKNKCKGILPSCDRNSLKNCSMKSLKTGCIKALHSSRMIVKEYVDEQIEIQRERSNTLKDKLIYSEDMVKARWFQERCKFCPNSVTSIIDALRLFLSEMMYYPLVLASIFSVIQIVVKYETNDKIASNIQWVYILVKHPLPILSFLFSVIQKFVTVYLLRIQLLGFSLYYIQKLRFGEKRHILKFFQGATWHVLFIGYSLALMIIQVCIMITIGRFYHLNLYINALNETKDVIANGSCVRFLYSLTSIKSGSLRIILNLTLNETEQFIYPCIDGIFWYLTIVGYFIPLFGVIMFFVPAYPFMKRFFIEFIKTIWNRLVKKNMEKGKAVDGLYNFLDGIDALPKDKEPHWCYQLFYPVFNIPSAILCTGYSFVLTFLIFSIKEVHDLGYQYGQDNFSFGFIYFLITIILLINIHTLVTAVLIMILLLMSGIITNALLIILCFFGKLKWCISFLTWFNGCTCTRNRKM